VRRAGLLGPWLWRLASSGQSALQRAAGEVVRASASQLAAAPEAVLLLRGGAIGAAPAPEPLQLLPGEVAPAAVDPPPAAAQRFGVAVGRYAAQGAARELAAELASHGFPTEVDREAGWGEAARFRVLLGPCATRAAAESLALRLRRRLLLPGEIVEVP
jgi:cell division septation protein DedD